MLSAADAAALCRRLEEHPVRFWLIGGWGVDALLHRQTRPHKDLDVLVRLADLPALRRLLDEHLVDVQGDGRVRQLYDAPWPLPASLDGTGTIEETIPTAGRKMM